MKKILKLTALVLAALFVTTACDKGPITEAEESLPVTITNVIGNWQLAGWQGKPLAEGLYSYITLERKDQKFTLYQNMDPEQSLVTTGRYNIIVDADGKAVIRGLYHYSMGQEWNNRYEITTLTHQNMVWQAVGNPDETMVYTRVDSIPVAEE